MAFERVATGKPIVSFLKREELPHCYPVDRCTRFAASFAHAARHGHGGLGCHTQQDYVRHVRCFAAFLRALPDTAPPRDSPRRRVGSQRRIPRAYANTLLIVQCSNYLADPPLKKLLSTTDVAEGRRMRKISDTIARLAALRRQPAAVHADGERSKRFSLLPKFGPNPGNLIARSYIPEELREGSPLVVVLHGCAQTALGYDYHSGWSQLADEAGFALLYAEQQRENNPNACFNWFLPADTRRRSGEVQSILEMVDVFRAVHNLDRGRLFVTGLSAGGAMAAAMLATYPELFAGGAIIAGLPFGVASTIPEAFDRMRGHGLPAEDDLQRRLRAASDHKGPWPRISIWHGSADQTVAPSNSEAVAAQWRGVHLVGRAPTYSTDMGARARQVWCNSFGVAVIESNLIARMGHGTPIGDGLGSPGPFMLDVGISSSREIAVFWGIAKSRGDATFAGQGTEELDPDRAFPADLNPEIAIHSSARCHLSEVSGVQKTIEDALRAARLMR